MNGGMVTGGREAGWNGDLQVSDLNSRTFDIESLV